MRKLVIQDNVVVNAILADDSFTLDGVELVADDAAQIGWVRTNGVFAAPVIPPAPVVVPQKITPLQARKQIRALGLAPLVAQYLAAQTDDVREDWDYCLDVDRDNALLRGAALAMAPNADPDAWLDAFFIAANQIKA